MTKGDPKWLELTSSLARIAFVTPRYGPGVVGGSEAVMAEAARAFAERSYEVEILTTCARSHFSWANEFDPGVSEDRGVVIRRFPTVTSRGLRSRFGLDDRVQRGDRLGERSISSSRALPSSFRACAGL